jgi:hypothetical protein
MALNTLGKLEVTDLDFDTIKSNLKTYLKGQSEFTDYDFEGSGLSTLLDILAYNTHYNAFMANMLANEMFLDTAVKRNSVVSHAKHLGYTPTSSKAPVAYLNVTANDATGGSLTMPAGHIFTTTISGTSYQFVNIISRTIQPSDGVYTFSNVAAYEGTYITTEFTHNTSDADEKFILDNNSVDISTLAVSVQTSASDSTTVTYTKANTLVDITATSTVFFVQETTNGEWEIYFGDGVVGKKLTDGNIVKASYVITNETEGNGASVFQSSGTIGTATDITVATSVSASGGAIPENLDSIKYNAPFSYATQNRAVTAADYKALLHQLYPNIESVAVWGGEYADPVVYGKVFMSIRPKTGFTLTTTTKATLVQSLKDYTVASITPEFVDPVTIFITPFVNFKFNDGATVKTGSGLETEVSDMITSYSDTDLQKFEKIFRFSQFTTKIDQVDPAIVSNITTIRASYNQTPTLDTATKYTIAFENSIEHSAGDIEGQGIVAWSTGFKIEGNANTLYFADDGVGKIFTYYLTGSTKTTVDSEAGTIDYNTGKIAIDSITITEVVNADGTIKFSMKPASNDLVPVRNQVFQIDTTSMTVTAAVDTIAAGTSNAGTAYNTTSSY